MEDRDESSLEKDERQKLAEEIVGFVKEKLGFSGNVLSADEWLKVEVVLAAATTCSYFQRVAEIHRKNYFRESEGKK